MFVNYGFYKHKNNLDVIIEVVKVKYRGPNYYKLKVNFTNKNKTGYFELNYNCKIYKKDFWLWSRVI